jgi:hypothetical protein
MFNVHFYQKVRFVLGCSASATPRPENSDWDEKDALFGLELELCILVHLLN